MVVMALDTYYVLMQTFGDRVMGRIRVTAAHVEDNFQVSTLVYGSSDNPRHLGSQPEYGNSLFASKINKIN